MPVNLDKLAVSKLDWSDRQLLIRVLEDRYAAVQGAGRGRNLDEVVLSVDRWNSHQRLAARLDPAATSRPLVPCQLPSQTRSTEDMEQSTISDLTDARATYSNVSRNSVLVEGEQDLPNLENVLAEFAGAPASLDASDVLRRIGTAQPKRRPTMTDQETLVYLLELSFLGVETTPARPRGQPARPGARECNRLGQGG